MPATVIATACLATFRRATSDVVMVTVSLTQAPIAKRTGECRNMADVQALFDDVVRTAKGSGMGFVASVRVSVGRKPAGFDKARLRLEHDPEAATR